MRSRLHPQEKTKGFAKLEEIEELRAFLVDIAKVCDEARDRGISDSELADIDFRRKKVHNAIEDLKGSIRVFVRVRPPSDKEASGASVHRVVHVTRCVEVQ